jgi:hypothetical protein
VSPSRTISVLDGAELIEFAFADLMKYHGPGSPGGVAHAFKVMERAFALVAPGGPPQRRQITVRTAFRGPGARDMGFDGKWAIHPAQVAALNELFSPAEDEVQRARAVIAALDAAEREGGRGAVALDGQMLDEAVRVAALRVLARAAAAG